MYLRHIASLGFLLTVSLVLPLGAQQKEPAPGTQEVRESLRNSKRTLVTENMQLTESEAKAFWPVYEDYQAELDALGDREIKLIENYGLTHKVMTDRTAGIILEKYLKIQRDEVELQEKYVARFDKVLPMTKVLRYYQLENKFRVAVDKEISSKIPLAE